MVYINFLNKIPKEIAIAIFELPNKSEAFSTIQMSNKKQKNITTINDLNNNQQNLKKQENLDKVINNLSTNNKSNFVLNYAQTISSKFNNSSNNNCSNDYYSSLSRPLKINCLIKKNIQQTNEIETNAIKNKKIIVNSKILQNFETNLTKKNDYKSKQRRRQKLIFNIGLKKIKQKSLYKRQKKKLNKFQQKKKQNKCIFNNKIQYNLSNNIINNESFNFIKKFDEKTNLNQNLNNDCNKNLQEKNLVNNCNIDLQVTKNKIINEPTQNEHLLKVEKENNNESRIILKNNKENLILLNEEKIQKNNENPDYWARKWLIEYGININYKKKNRERIISGDYDNINVNEYNNFYSKNFNNNKNYSELSSIRNFAKKFTNELNNEVKKFFN